MASQRRAEKRRRTLRLASMAAAFMLVFCIGITFAIGPTDAQAGGDGEVKVITNVQDGQIKVDEFSSFDTLPETLKETFIMFELKPEIFTQEKVCVTKMKDCTQLDSVYTSEGYGQIEINQCIIEDSVRTEHYITYSDVIENWNGIDVHITQYNTGDCQRVYAFVYGRNFVHIRTSQDMEKELVKEMMLEATK